MTAAPPAYLKVPLQQLGADTPVKVVVCGDAASLAQHMARTMLDEIVACQRAGRSATLIVPVGPVDQFPILAQQINQQRIDCRDVMLINMDEYLTDEGRWLPVSHPLSFRGYMDRRFYDLIDAELRPRPENRVFPDPDRPRLIETLIAQRGGVDACFGGIGINGHIAFNEPPEPGEDVSVEAFAALPTRVLTLSRETRTINANTVGGDIGVIPRQAVTLGMREILASRRLRLYCNRPWQSAVVRRVLHGPVAAACPASLMRHHHDAVLAVTDEVAAVPDIRLR